jgi:hypothetical protein
MRSRVHARAALLVFVASCQAPNPELLTLQQAIVGGSTTTGDPAVPAIYIIQGEYVIAMCTGTLISPRVVLTAAPCVAPDSGGDAWAVYFGANVNDGSDPAFLALRDVTAHTYHPSYSPSDIGSGNDLALLQIQDTGPVAPKPINRVPLTAAHVGQPVRLVGFGETGGGGDTSGIKRQASSVLADYDTLLAYFGASGGNTCQGDSGGPNFMTIGGTEVVVGVTSFGDPGCDEYGAGGRVDRFQAFIDPWVASHDTIGCGMDGGCATSCGGTPDPDCPCATDGLCTASCTIAGADADCPADCARNGTCLMTGCPIPDPDCASCGDDGNCAEGCATEDPDCPVGVGEPCQAGPECVSGQCLPDPQDSNVSFCTSACNSDGTGCPDGMTCSDFGGQWYCIYDGIAPGAVGQACDGAEDCASGMCEGFGEEQLCTAICNDGYSCREGWSCEPFEGQTDGLCVPYTPPPMMEEKKNSCRSSVAGRAGEDGLAGGLLLLAALILLARRRDPSRAGS